MRIELKFRLIHERMLAEPEASNNRRRLWRWDRLRGGVEAAFSSTFFRSFESVTEAPLSPLTPTPPL
jgi:hypothetical protein